MYYLLASTLITSAVLGPGLASPYLLQAGYTFSGWACAAMVPLTCLIVHLAPKKL